MHWNTDDIVDAVVVGLKDVADGDDLEQAVRSVDARRELGLHPLLHAALEAAGYGVWPEQRYPADRADPRRNRGRRCDVVLTRDRRPLRYDVPASGDTVGDERAVADGTPGLVEALFDPVALADAYWMEVKTATQFADGEPHPGYSQRLLQAASKDIVKIADDPDIVHAGLLLVIFARDETTARHDATAWHMRCLEKELPLGFPSSAGLALSDRLGNGYASVSLFPVR